jgi:hypothetical protein
MDRTVGTIPSRSTSREERGDRSELDALNADHGKPFACIDRRWSGTQPAKTADRLRDCDDRGYHGQHESRHQGIGVRIGEVIGTITLYESEFAATGFESRLIRWSFLGAAIHRQTETKDRMATLQAGHATKGRTAGGEQEEAYHQVGEPLIPMEKGPHAVQKYV